MLPPRLLKLAAVLLVAATCVAPARAQQPAPGWATSTDARPPGVEKGGGTWTPAAPSPPALKGPQIDSKVPPANTTTIQRPTIESRTSGQITLAAFLTDDVTQPIDQGLIWRIYRDKPGTDGKPRLLSSHREASPLLKLDVGDYVVNVALGRANLTRKVSVAAGKAVTEKFIVNAGGLKILTQLASGEPTPENMVAVEIFADERDQSGSRISVMSGARPGTIIRLNAGIYHLVSTYGDANATVRADVTVEPGKLTEAAVVHSAAKVTFKLVMREGGEALADTQWSVLNQQGEPVKESAGALPTHMLAAGSYVVNAKRAGQVFRQEFTVRAGDASQIEVVSR